LMLSSQVQHQSSPYDKRSQRNLLPLPLDKIKFTFWWI
jgi:hypothetical protein